MNQRTMLRLSNEDHSFSFEIATAAYQKQVATRGSRWAEQERLGREAALQYVGYATAETTLDGVIYPAMLNGGSLQEGITKLRMLCLSPKPVLMVTGVGHVCAYWSVVEVSDTRSYFMDNGQARKIEFSVKLRFYGLDRAGRSGAVRNVLSLPRGVQPASSFGKVAVNFPPITKSSTFEQISAAAQNVGAVMQEVVNAASEVLAVVQNPLSLIPTIAGVVLPVEVLGGIRDVAQSAQQIIDVGGQVFDTLSAVAALPYSVNGIINNEHLYTVISSLHQNMVCVRDVSLLVHLRSEMIGKTMANTGATFTRVASMSSAKGAASRQAVADVCAAVGVQASKTASLSQSINIQSKEVIAKLYENHTDKR